MPVPTLFVQTAMDSEVPENGAGSRSTRRNVTDCQQTACVPRTGFKPAYSNGLDVLPLNYRDDLGCSCLKIWVISFQKIRIGR